MPAALSWFIICSRLVAPPSPRLARLRLAVVGDLAGARFVLDDREAVAGRRDAGEAQHFDRHRRAGFLDLATLVVDQRADAGELGAGNDDVADPERAALHQHGADRTAAAIELGFDDEALGTPGRIGTLSSSTSACSRMVSSSLSRPVLGDRRDFDVERIAAHRFDEHFVLQQLGADARRVRPTACPSC
jgi:hypothetical protein